MCEQPPTPFVSLFCGLGLKPFPTYVCEAINSSAFFEIKDDNRRILLYKTHCLFSVIHSSFVDIKSNLNFLKFTAPFEILFDFDFRCFSLGVNLTNGSEYDIGAFGNNLSDSISFRDVSFCGYLDQYEGTRNKYAKQRTRFPNSAQFAI